jgi:hypothetical protein
MGLIINGLRVFNEILHGDLSGLDYASAGHTGFAPSASPTLTGVPIAPTAAIDTDTTQIATTEFVNNQIEQGTQPTLVALSDVPVKGGVFNGGFELAPSFVAVQTANNWIDGTAAGSATITQYGWYLLGTAATFAGSFDSTVSHSGKYSMKVSATNTTGKAIATNIGGTFSFVEYNRWLPLIKQSTKYRLSGWIKTNNAAASAVWLQFNQYSSIDGTAGTVTTLTKITGTVDWTYYSIVITSDNIVGGSYVAIFCQNAVAGNVSDAWFDDITIEEVVENTTFTGIVPTPVKPTIVGVTTTSNIDQSLDPGWAAASNYNTTNAVNEGATHRQTFTPTRNKVSDISFYIGENLGAETNYLVVHDAANVVIASRAFAGLDAWAGIKHSYPFLWTAGALHFHIYSAAGATSIMASSNDLENGSFIEYYAKPTENATIICNGERISTNAEEDGLFSGAIVDMDKGEYTYVNGFNSQSLLCDIYSASAGGETTMPVAVNGWAWNNTLESIQSASGATARHVIFKVNTMFPIKSLKITPTIFNNNSATGLVEISLENSIYTTIWTLAASASAQTQTIYTEFPKGYTTFYLKLSKDTTNQYIRFDNLVIEADLDTSSAPSLILQPLATPIQYSDNITLPSNADRIYLRMAKYANDRGIVVPHLEFCSTTTPVKVVPLKADNSGETLPAVKFISSETDGTPTIGTGAQDGSTGNFCISDGLYIGVTAGSQFKITYQIGKETTPAGAPLVTTFSHLTMNRFFLSSNGNYLSATKDPSHQFNFYLGMLKEGFHKIIEGIQRAICDLSYFTPKFGIAQFPYVNWGISSMTYAAVTDNSSFPIQITIPDPGLYEVSSLQNVYNQVSNTTASQFVVNTQIYADGVAIANTIRALFNVYPYTSGTTMGMYRFGSYDFTYIIRITHPNTVLSVWAHGGVATSGYISMWSDAGRPMDLRYRRIE